METAAHVSFSAQAADLAGGLLAGVEAVERLGSRMRRARIERQAQEFALVPGGGPQHRLNALGLHIAYDTYRTGLKSAVTAVHRGDGGESACGGYGRLLGWLPLATADRNPFAAEFAYGPDGEGLCESFATRPVIAL